MISIFLAKVLGVYLVVVCASVLMNRRRWAAMVERADSDLQMYTSGAIIFLLGLVLVNLHNVWTADYRGVVTFLGWLTLFKGLVRLLWGHKAVSWGKSAFHSSWYTPLVAIFLVLGLWLANAGFNLV